MGINVFTFTVLLREFPRQRKTGSSDAIQYKTQSVQLYLALDLDFGFTCDNADPAAVFDFDEVLPSVSTDDAALAAFGLVVLLFAILLPSHEF